MARVGIVMAVHNAADFLAQTLASVQAQTLQSWHCVLVDDGSTDSSGAMCDRAAEQDVRFTVLHQPNGGVSVARNAGIAALEPCEFLSFLDADDVWEPHALEVLVDAVVTADTIAAHGLAETIDVRGDIIVGFAGFQRARSRPGLHRFEPLDHDGPTTLDTTLFVNRVYPPGVWLVRADVQSRAGLFDAELEGIEDTDMLLRLLELGEFAYVDRVLLSYRRHGNNATNDGVRIRGLTRQLHVRAFERLLPTIGRPTLRRWWRQWELLKLAEARAELRSPRVAARVVVHAWRYVRGWPSTGPFG